MKGILKTKIRLQNIQFVGLCLYRKISRDALSKVTFNLHLCILLPAGAPASAPDTVDWRYSNVSQGCNILQLVVWTCVEEPCVYILHNLNYPEVFLNCCTFCLSFFANFHPVVF